jgi:hypothetical protein
VSAFLVAREFVTTLPDPPSVLYGGRDIMDIAPPAMVPGVRMLTGAPEEIASRIVGIAESVRVR